MEGVSYPAFDELVVKYCSVPDVME